MSALLLGPVAFEAFEVPGRIEFGGGQRLSVHALPGGVRIVDAMGRDDAPIIWSGVFTGPTAAERVRLLDLLRSAGESLLLVWDDFVFQVVIAGFEVRFERANWIPYRVSCVVLSDLALPDQLAVSLVAQLGGDLASAQAYQADASQAGQFQAASAAIAAPGAVTLGTEAYGQSAAALAAASAGASAQLDAGAAALDQAQTVGATAAAAQQMAQAAASIGYLQRAQGNLARAGS